ncbi:hypothetical protein BpHYR1_024350 [Brachionus plicatilis]|uniref:Uncharacterized protein n=1 Tax=Brachionus plicatilis TaxID=10195 RepID=A0A3M7RZK0_BRAPC|nr:hypothetical protein BpHYR1_024350 [Brachionus plicatilis]
MFKIFFVKAYENQSISFNLVDLHQILNLNNMTRIKTDKNNQFIIFNNQSYLKVTNYNKMTN